MKNKQSLFLSKKKLLWEAGCDDFKEAAKILFSKAFGMSLAESYKYQTHEGSKEKATLFSNMIRRRLEGEPTSHIVCSRSFWKNDFYLFLGIVFFFFLVHDGYKYGYKSDYHIHTFI